MTIFLKSDTLIGRQGHTKASMPTSPDISTHAMHKTFDLNMHSIAYFGMFMSSAN